VKFLFCLFSCFLTASLPAFGAPSFAYITNQGSDTVSVVDIATQQVTAKIPVSRKPVGVAVSQGGTVLCR
jgi:YVTN family beta-propeller protein